MRYLYMLPAAFLVPVIHEWVKAIASTIQGDPTPRNTGHLTLNPFKYFEPIGFVFMLIFGMGWGNPTPTAALHYKDRRRGVIVTYMTPVLVNLLLGIGTVVLVNVLLTREVGSMPHGAFFFYLNISMWTSYANDIILMLLAHFAFMNICFALFNLIPVYPLAANKLLLTFSRPDTIARVSHYEKPMQVILILMLFFGFVMQVISPAAHWIIRMAWGFAA